MERDSGQKINSQQLIERSRETNILIKGLTNKIFLLEGKTDPTETEKEIKERPDRKDKIGQDIRQDRGQKIRDFIRKLFRGEV